MALTFEVPASIGKGLAKLRATMLVPPASPPSMVRDRGGARRRRDARVAARGHSAGARAAVSLRGIRRPQPRDRRGRHEARSAAPRDVPGPARLRDRRRRPDDLATEWVRRGAPEGAHIADTVHQLLAKQPQLRPIAVTPDGPPIELPLARMGIPSTISSAHFALRPTRAAIAIDDPAPPSGRARGSRRPAHARRCCP